MSEKDMKVIEMVLIAIPKMSEFEKGYFLGLAETKARECEKAAEPEKTPA